MATRKYGTLTADVVETVVIDGNDGLLEVVNRSGTAEIWFTLDGEDPVAEADDVFLVLAGKCGLAVATGPSATVKLLSSGTPDYAVLGS